jgi:two-component system CheB/CheR fusion protein
LYAFGLGAIGALVRSARNVAEAKAALALAPFDVVVSDIAMPDETGYDLVQWLRSTPGENQRTAALALTGMVTGHDRRAAFAAGFDEHCLKPCSVEKVVSAIELLFRSRYETG